MRKSAKKDVGDTIKIKLSYDPTVRMPPTPEAFRQALRNDKDAQKAWRHDDRIGRRSGPGG